MKILSTKLLNEKEISFAKSMNIDLHCLDFIKVNGIDFDFDKISSEKFDSIVFTSANAVNYFFKNKKCFEFLKEKNIFSISGKTSEELSKQKLKIKLTGKTSEELSKNIIQTKNVKSILHLCGNLNLDILGKNLTGAGIKYFPLTVYQTVLQNKIVNEKFDAMLFFSPSGVESFFVNNKLDSETVCCCIGETTASALRKKYSEAKIVLPKEPNVKFMLEELLPRISRMEKEKKLM